MLLILSEKSEQIGFLRRFLWNLHVRMQKMNSMDYISFQADGYDDWKSSKLQLDKSRSPRFNLFNHFSLIKLLSFTNLKIPEM